MTTTTGWLVFDEFWEATGTAMGGNQDAVEGQQCLRRWTVSEDGEPAVVTMEDRRPSIRCDPKHQIQLSHKMNIAALMPRIRARMMEDNDSLCQSATLKSRSSHSSVRVFGLVLK